MCLLKFVGYKISVGRAPIGDIPGRVSNVQNYSGQPIGNIPDGFHNYRWQIVDVAKARKGSFKFQGFFSTPPHTTLNDDDAIFFVPKTYVYKKPAVYVLNLSEICSIHICYHNNGFTYSNSTMFKRNQPGATDSTTTTTSTKRSHNICQDLLRALQFLSALTSLILFSVRIAKIIRLAGRATRSNGAVEGILAAAVLYTLVAMAMRFCIRGTGSNALRFIFIILDLLFVAAFIVVAVLTSPKRHGSSAPCTRSSRVNGYIPGTVNCNLPWGTFILAIFST